MNLQAEVKRLLGTKVKMPRSTRFDRIYHESFETSGMKKAVEVLADLQRHPINLERCAYFSIGGSTGSEIFHVLNNCQIRYGLLLEYNPSATMIAQEKRATLQKIGKELVIVTGDAMQQLKYCKDEFLDWRDAKKIDGLIVSAQAVLHELPSRSPGFDLNHFIGEITWDWDPFLFYSREPCAPVDWPKRVEIHVPGLDSELLEALAKDVQSTSRMEGALMRSGPQWVSLPSDLAIEAITKIFYLEDYSYEVGEQVTSIDPDTLRAILEHNIGENSTTLTRLASESFKEKYREIGIQARRPPRGERLYMPETFAWIVAERTSASRRRFVYRG
jgi:hypothetical protein